MDKEIVKEIVDDFLQTDAEKTPPPPYTANITLSIATLFGYEHLPIYGVGIFIIGWVTVMVTRLAVLGYSWNQQKSALGQLTWMASFFTIAYYCVGLLVAWMVSL